MKVVRIAAERYMTVMRDKQIEHHLLAGVVVALRFSPGVSRPTATPFMALSMCASSLVAPLGRFALMPDLPALAFSRQAVRITIDINGSRAIRQTARIAEVIRLCASDRRRRSQTQQLALSLPIILQTHAALAMR